MNFYVILFLLRITLSFLLRISPYCRVNLQLRDKYIAAGELLKIYYPDWSKCVVVFGFTAFLFGGTSGLGVPRK
jgi:hypothetical protein